MLYLVALWRLYHPGRDPGRFPFIGIHAVDRKCEPWGTQPSVQWVNYGAHNRLDSLNIDQELEARDSLSDGKH